MTEEASERKSIVDTVHQLFIKPDYAGLDALEVEYRGSGSTLPSGGTKLSVYYDTVIDGVAHGIRPGTCDARWTDYLDAWQAASPHAPAPIIVRAAVLEAVAWCYRGSGKSDSVAPEAWAPFNRNIAAAATLLDAHGQLGTVDPEFYVERLSLAIAQGQTREKFDRLLNTASARYPYFYDIYYAAYRYYQPQWYGSLADIDALARYAADKTRARDGTGAYARIYYHSVLCGCLSDLRAVDWPTMQSAMADLAARYPVDWTYLHLVQLSCLLGGRDEAKRYLAKLEVNQTGGWSEEDWDRCRALVGPSPQPFPTTDPDS